jgi:hypothetical protein
LRLANNPQQGKKNHQQKKLLLRPNKKTFSKKRSLNPTSFFDSGDYSIS